MQLEEEKTNYFSNLLKVKMESHFFKFFENQSGNYSKNNSNMSEISKFTGPDKGFLSFFSRLNYCVLLYLFVQNMNKLIPQYQ